MPGIFDNKRNAENVASIDACATLLNTKIRIEKMTGTNKKIIDRIINKTKDSNVIEALADKISLSDLQSLLLEVYRKRVDKIEIKNLFSQYKSNRFTKPSTIQAEKYLDFEQLAVSLLSDDYRMLEISPVAPLGCCSVVAPIDQNSVLTTVRNTEVCSDPTNVLAMECARLREQLLKNREDRFKKIKLCTSQRVLRTQPFEGKDSVAHFKLLSLCAAGRDEGAFSFEIETLMNQLNYYIDLLNNLSKIGISIPSIRILLIVYNPAIKDKLQYVVHQIGKENSNVRINPVLFENKQSYYETIRYNIFATNYRGEEYFICDGGFTDWTQKLLNNRKERLLTSGFGIERLFLVF